MGLLHGPQHENMHSPVDCRPWRLATLVNPIDHQWVQIRSKVEVSLPSTGCDSSHLELPWKHDAGDGVVCCQRFNPLLPDGGRTLSSQLNYRRPPDNTPWHVPDHSFAARKPDPVAHRHGDGGIREYESVVNGDASAYDEDDVAAHRHGDGGVREYESVVNGDGSAYFDGRDDDDDDDDEISGGDAPAIDEAPTFDSDYETSLSPTATASQPMGSRHRTAAPTTQSRTTTPNTRMDLPEPNSARPHNV